MDWITEYIAVVNFIDDVISSGERILFHCHAGRSRSVCMAARYFMIKQGMTSQTVAWRIVEGGDVDSLVIVDFDNSK